jgi:hypothetical protein
MRGAALILLVGAAGAVALEPSARADDLAQEAIFGTLAGAGVVGTIITGIAAAVYAIDGRAFDSGWVFTAIISGALSTGMATALIVDGVRKGVGLEIAGGVLAAALTAWPTYWMIKGSLYDVDPGERFETATPKDQPEGSGARAIALPALSLHF